MKLKHLGEMKVKLKSFEKEKTTEKIMNTDEPAQKQEVIIKSDSPHDSNYSFFQLVSVFPFFIWLSQLIRCGVQGRKKKKRKCDFQYNSYILRKTKC